MNPAFEWPIPGVLGRFTDAGGIVFYANYLKFFERAALNGCSLGLGQQALKDETGACSW